ncbi:MAG: hypothetical protein K6F84_05240 [Lachnospiraceae bacterium]|nr:hypothetical protein [Lachnospiraceae bacterium]
MYTEAYGKLDYSNTYNPYVSAHGDSQIYKSFFNKLLNHEQGLIFIIMNLAVYLSVIAVIVSAVMLIAATFGSSEKLTEAKQKILRVFLVTICIFGTTSIINLIANLAIK